jgi:hypothetical protein
MLASPGNADPEEVPLDHDRDLVAWLGMSGEHVLVAWEVDNPNRVQVRVHNVHTGETINRVNVARSRTADRPRLARTPDRTHVAVGSIWFTPDDTVVANEEDLRPLTAGEHMFAVDADNQPGSVSPEGRFTLIEAADVPIPVGFGADGEAIVRVGGLIYVLPVADPNEETPDQPSTDQPSQSGTGDGENGERQARGPSPGTDFTPGTGPNVGRNQL